MSEKEDWQCQEYRRSLNWVKERKKEENQTGIKRTTIMRRTKNPILYAAENVQDTIIDDEKDIY